MSTPSTTKAWSVEGKTGFDSLKFDEKRSIEPLGSQQVLVRIKGVSLNYRDLIIPKGQYGLPHELPRIPCSDGAGEVVAVGDKVVKWKKGDKVVTLFNAKHYGGSLDQKSILTGLGGSVDGTLREYGAFDEEGLVAMPSNLNFLEASTLTCAGLTAWNALFGLESKALQPGDWVLTQGTGGVSIFALQFAKASGARVIATTGSDDKAETLKRLGADHIINYKTTPEWGAKAKELTGGVGANHIVEVAGPKSMKQSIDAVALDGVITIIGFVGGMTKDSPGFLDCLIHLCTVRGIVVGPRTMMEQMCKAIEANGDKLKPILDKKTFKLEQAKEAYEYQWSQAHIGKVCIEV